MDRPFSRVTALATAVLLSLAAACGAGQTADPQGGNGADGGEQEGTELTVGFAAEPANLDFTTTDGAAIPEALLVNVYEGLVKINQDGEIVPLLAESWEISDDRTVYDFRLREGVQFTNGEPFTAEDVKFSIERVQSDDWTVSLKAAMDVVESVEAVDDHHARVTLSEPSNRWLFQMTTRIGAMFSREGVDDLANEPIGTGPYMLDDWVRGDRIVLERNPDYWGDAPGIQTVTFRYFNDASALTNAMLSGGVDVIGTVQEPETLEQFESDEYQVIQGTTNGEVVLSFNNGREPLSDVRVRQAIKHAIDHEAVLETAWAGRGELIGSMVPPHDPWYEDLTGVYDHDPDRARELLEEADATDLQLAFRIPNLPYAVSSAQVVQSQLEEVGIRTKLDVLEFPARWLEVVFTNHNYDMSIIAHVEPRDIVTFGDPDYYWQYDNPEVQQMLDEADSAQEGRRDELMRDVARTIAEDAAADWLFLLPNLIVAAPDVDGLPTNRVGEAFDLTELTRG
ncbi:MAG TPA: ABC transporter substrate-binding protein [Egibacteraceae bacterium]|nr:ABC transporter substrate-binding protein [Egibacteraceae bacterium]